MRKGFWATGVSMLALSACFMCYPVIDIHAEEIPDGVYVGDQNLGGMTKEEAGKSIEDYVNSLSGQQITIKIAGDEIKTTAEDLGFHWSNTDAVDEAAAVTASGNLVKRFFALKELEENPIRIPLETELDSDKVASFVEEKCSSYTQEAQEAAITRENEAFVITDSQVGRTVDIAATAAALDKALESGLSEPVSVDAVVAETQPIRTRENLETISDVLGSFSTSFSSSGASRSTNLKVGSGKVNGTVLMPGEQLSGYELMSPFTTANGYATAASYENGMVVDSVGGGVCQISTTLYNAALRAELEITQRQNHSMIVTYVDPSADAAIAGTYKDLKFKNNYDTPIYIEGYTSDRTLYFVIYGKETRPSNRTVKYVSETLKTTDPGNPVEKLDNSLKPGTRVKEQSSHRGYQSRLWKCVYVDGVETEKILLHTDKYNASPAIYRVGPAAPAVTEPIQPTQPAPGPVETEPQTEAPAPTQAPSPGQNIGPATDPGSVIDPEPAAGPGSGGPAGPGAS